MLNLLCLGFLNGHTINRHCQLRLGRLGSLSLLDLLAELQLPDSLLHHVNSLGLVNFC